MQKTILVALLAIAISAFAAPQHCDFFKGFGNSFVGPHCSSDLNTGCVSGFDAFEQIKKLLSGDNNALFSLIADLTSIYTAALSSVETCEYMPRVHQFMENIFKIYVIVMQHFIEFKKDFECVIEAYTKEECLKLGECLGDFLHILTTKA